VIAMNFGKSHQTLVSLLEFFARSGSSADRAMEEAVRFARAFPGCVLRMPRSKEIDEIEPMVARRGRRVER
jgi:hypothetical protein